MKTNYKFAAAAIIGGFLASTCVMADGPYRPAGSSELARAASRFSDKFYVRANVIAPTYRKFTDYTAKFRLGGQVAAGWEFHKNAAAELEVDYITAPIKNKDITQDDNRKVHSWVGFINIVAHPNLLNSDEFKPFGGVGVGYARTTVGQSKTATKKTSGSLAYQVFLGLEWVVMPNVSMLADVRWVDLGKAKVQVNPNSITSNRFRAQIFTVGVKYKF
jgi:opacity protein-like surface antigen